MLSRGPHAAPRPGTAFVMAAACAWAPLAWIGSAGGAPQRPNVLIVLLDDLGYSDLGCMGGEIPTPHIDRLAAGGVTFTQCYNSARCCPSRASLMTGLYPHQTGIGAFATKRPRPRKGPAYLGHLNDRCVTLAEALGPAGYQSYFVGKWHMERPGPIARGWDEFYGYVLGYEQDQWDPSGYERLPQGREQELAYDPGGFYATDVFSDYALEFLRQARSRRSAGEGGPWLLHLSHSSPHFPVQAPRESVDRFVETYRRGWDLLREQRFERMRASGLATDRWRLTDRSPVPRDRQRVANGYAGRPNPAWDSLPAARREDLARRMAIFAAMVSHVDEGVGRIVADLRAAGELDNTLILVTSDNGACYEWGPLGFDGPSRRGVTTLHTGGRLRAMGGPGTYHSYGSAWANLSNTPLRLYKHFCHEGGACSPLIAHWPREITGPRRWAREPVHLMDIMPTLLDVAGASYPAGKQPLEGRSLRPAWRGKALPERGIATEHFGARAYRRGDWKIAWPVRMPWPSGWELYNLREDRCETTDLAAEQPERVQRMAAEWMAWAKRVGVHPFAEQAPTQQPQEKPRLPRPARPQAETPGVKTKKLRASAATPHAAYPSPRRRFAGAPAQAAQRLAPEGRGRTAQRCYAPHEA